MPAPTERVRRENCSCLLTRVTDTSIVSSSSVDVVPDMSGKSISGDARFPHLPLSKDVVLKHWTLVSDDLMSALESESSESPEFDALSDEIRRWSSLSEGECQRFVSAEDGILNEFEMM